MSEPGQHGSRLLVGQVPGVTTTKWQRIWQERFPQIPVEFVDVAESAQRRALDSGRVDLCFVRLPIDRDGLHLIPLYEEVAVVVARKDHPISVYDEVELAELADENEIEADHPDAVDLVAGGAGVMYVPQSIARAQSRRDLVYRPVIGRPPTRIGLAWRVAEEIPLVEDFIGIVRGRTPNSSRSRTSTPKAELTKAGPAKPRPARTASPKTGSAKSGTGKTGAGKTGAGKTGGRRPPKKRR